ncbi:hypothetical protein LGH70_19695 [Hymenobacter sp. BT635]|uniref:Phage recombination protein Bet n=1 Tax=Hymenobacter nitidus TaxID=2880929 RepID=A0ABS8AHB9_9BACT|nr:hypothetical protein [Hymenobacter nitidus]MCB2379830.1 hypothetical protein [Hymenobacter nitidus]
MQTIEQLETFRNLCKANGLGKTDVWQHKQSGNWIISRPGIEKIQGLNNIKVDIELAAAGADFAVVKATAVRSVDRRRLSVQSLGSANAKNSHVSYYAEMAEKRAKSRSILMLMGFYELGVYGEEESDEFKQSKNVGAPTLDDVDAVRPTQPAPVASVPATVIPTAPAASEENPLVEVLAQLATAPKVKPIWEANAHLQQNQLFVEACATRKQELATERTAAAAALYEFAEQNQAALGVAETGRLMGICQDATVATASLLLEKEQGMEWLMEEMAQVENHAHASV